MSTCFSLLRILLDFHEDIFGTTNCLWSKFGRCRIITFSAKKNVAAKDNNPEIKAYCFTTNFGFAGYLTLSDQWL